MSNPEIIAASTSEPYSNQTYRDALRFGHMAGMRIHGDYHLAEDAAQKGVLALWEAAQKAIKGGKPVEHPMGLASTAARFAAIDELKRRKRMYVDSEMVDALGKNGSSPDAYETFDTCEAVMQAVASLSAQRTNDTRDKIFQLTAAEFTPPEISDLLGVTLGSVHAVLKRGKLKLRERREEFGL